MKSFICAVLSILIVQLQFSGLAVSAYELASAPAHGGVIITPLRGGVEVVTKKGARIVRKVRRVKYYRSSGGSSKRTVRRYHFVKHSRSVNPNKTRIGNKVITKASKSTAVTHSASMELPRDIVAPLIIRGVDNLQAGKRYIEVTERDGKLFIKEGGEIDPNGQFLEVEEEDGVWKIKGTDIVIDFANTFDVSKVPPGVKKYLNQNTDTIAPGENYVQYVEQDGKEVIPIQADTIPPLVNPGDYAEIHQVPVGGELGPGTWETIDVPVGNGPIKEGVLLPGVGSVPVETGVPGIGTAGVPVETGVPGIGTAGVPVETGVPGTYTAGPPVYGIGETPVGGVAVPGIPMPVGGGVSAPGVPAPAATPMAAAPPPPPVDPPAAPAPPPVMAVAPASPEPPVGALTAPGFPMAAPIDKPGNIVPFTPVGAVPPPSAGGGGFPLGGLIPAALGAAALGGLIVPLALMRGNNGGNYGGGYYYPYPGGGGGTTYTGGSPGIIPGPQISPPVTPPVCTTPPTTCPPPPCPPPPCPPPPCPPAPPVCTLPPPCPPPYLPPPCPPMPCPPPPCPPPVYGGCDTGYGYGYGCDTGYGYDSGYGCDTGYGGGYGSGYGGGYGGSDCMGNASKFGFNQPDSCATSYKERWWSQAGRQYDYNGPCAAEQACAPGSNCAPSRSNAMSCAPGSNCAPSRSTAMSNPCPPY